MNSTQSIEANWVRSGTLAVTLADPPPAVEAAGRDGTAAGQRVLAAALSAAIGPALSRAAELLRVVRDADRTDAEHDGVVASIGRRAADAAALLFGPALDAKLADLDRERAAADAARVDAFTSRNRAAAELGDIRDAVTGGGVAAVADAVAARMQAATAERQRAADKLLAVMAEPLARLLALDAELGVLAGVQPREAVKAEVVAALPAAFAESGLTPFQPYDWRAERAERDEEARRRGWGDADLAAGPVPVPRWAGDGEDD